MTNILTPETINKLVVLANQHLANEAERPKVPTKRLRQTIENLQKEEKGLMAVVLKYQATQDVSVYMEKGAKIRKAIGTAQERRRRFHVGGHYLPQLA